MIRKYRNDDGAYGWVLLGTIQVHHEIPGKITKEDSWVIFHGGYMYGPCDSFWQAVWIFLSEYKSDRNIVG